MSGNTTSPAIAEACQTALSLALRDQAADAYDLLEAVAERDALTDADLRDISDAGFLAGRWTGWFARGVTLLRRLLVGVDSPATRGWIVIRMSLLSRDDESRALRDTALGEFTVAGDDAGQAMSVLALAFPMHDLLPSAAFRLGLVEAAHQVGVQLGDPVTVARALTVRAALLTYTGEIEEADTTYRRVIESFHFGPPMLGAEVALAALNQCLAFLSLGRVREIDDVLTRTSHVIDGPRTRNWRALIRGNALVLAGQHRRALRALPPITEPSEEVAAYLEVVRTLAKVEVDRTPPGDDLTQVAEFLESRSMQLGSLARAAQATLRAVRGEPRPHRDLAPALHRLIPSRPRFGWDRAALSLAELAPAEEAHEALAPLWDFWPAGPVPAVHRSMVEALLGLRAPYSSFLEAADALEAAGLLPGASRAMVHASRAAPSGAESLRAHRRALDLLSRTDAERSIAGLIRARRLRREPGAPTIPDSQRHVMNPGLTPREREVVELAAAGMTGPEIATRLSISPGTVRNHLQRARDKLGGISKRDLGRLHGGDARAGVKGP
ncbi:sigma factor-like helix-turn-helix DNA-binding protein [Agromyces sp. NPDC058104]|uniref:helix-turn-helix transcriptional regulator n=1 Tax=Agromyces sp. NPDC058104 TaxID=3346342 RepID=UPI0036DE6BA9